MQKCGYNFGPSTFWTPEDFFITEDFEKSTFDICQRDDEPHEKNGNKDARRSKFEDLKIPEVDDFDWLFGMISLRKS